MQLRVLMLLGVLMGVSMASIQCLDDNNNPVDWWVIFKVPYLPDSDDPVAQSGYAYAYADKNSPVLTYDAKALTTNSSNALAHTLNQVYDGNPEDVGWMFYNDEEPDGSTHSSYGHTKGDLGFDNNGGFWLIHSVPRWPEAPPYWYYYPDSEKDYGQSMLCMSFNLNYLNDVGGQFLLNKPYVYSSNLNSEQEQAMPNMVSVLDKDFETSKAANATVKIVSNGGVQLTTFAKNSAWNQSLYEDLAEPGIDSGMLVETWQNGSGGKMPSFCTPEYEYDSINVREITFNSDVLWPETKDHSKWGISYDKSNWVCIGDINRMYSQNTRGGGTYCFENNDLYSSILAIISDADYC